jgi:hypothetical protein
MNITAKQIALFFATGGGVAILLMAAQQWISIEVGSQLADAGIVPAAEVAAIKDDVQENADDIVRVESKAERIAQILMED